nr:unnamed protein product [uncultured Mediterranean phage uvMED]BAR24864.1 unnamed protein product [uncultured Mediterranean phage uvMED]
MDTTQGESKPSEILPESLKDHQGLLDSLDQYASTVLCNEADELRRSQLLRLFADEIGCPINEKTATIVLCKAQGQIDGVSVPRKRGEKLDTTPTPWAWEGVIMSGTFNLLVAPPKVGKSALMVGMISAWFHGEESYLGQKLHGTCPKVYIIGTDQPESDWNTLFQREGLVNRKGELSGPIEMLWHTGAPLHLTAEGIKHLCQIAEENPGSFFLLDSYHACCVPLGLEEAASSFDGPARQLAEALAPHKATLAMIHHTNKSVSGGNATNASRGSNALPAAASLTILMNWFKQPAEGQTQSDHRVVLKTQGRAKGTTLLIELEDDGWVHHGDGESVLAAESIQEAADELQGRQADIFDYMCERWSDGQFPVVASELADVAKCNASKVNRALRALEKKNLVIQDGQLEPLVSGGRPQLLWVPNVPSPETGGKGGKTSTTSRALHEIRGYSPSSPCSPNSVGTSTAGVLPPGTPVELLRGGAWANGWVIVNASNPDSIRVAKLGSPHVTVSSLRWQLDVRVGQLGLQEPVEVDPASTKPETFDPFDF